MTHDQWLTRPQPSIEMEGDFESTVTYCPYCKEYYEDEGRLHNFDDLGIAIERELCDSCETDMQIYGNYNN